jgi:hypothetical protein
MLLWRHFGPSACSLRALSNRRYGLRGLLLWVAASAPQTPVSLCLQGYRFCPGRNPPL